MWHRNRPYRAYLFGLLGATLLVATLYVKTYPLSIFEGSFAWVGNGMQLAASSVGMSVAVSPNQYNTLALQLQEKDKQLTEKERELTAKELEIQNKENLQVMWQGWLILLVGSVLFFLIALNYYLDYRRRNQIL